MERIITVTLLLILGAAGDAAAQGMGEIPIESDLRRERRIERRLEGAFERPSNPNATPANPDGVVGFDGPPNDGINAVINSAPLPPGSISNLDD